MQYDMSPDAKIMHFWVITALTGCCLDTVSQQMTSCKVNLSYSANATQLSAKNNLTGGLKVTSTNKGNLTYSQSTLNTFHMIIETHSPSVWLSLSVNIEWLVWGLVWAQWAIWHFEEALSHKLHRAVFYVITDIFLPLLAIHSHCDDVHEGFPDIYLGSVEEPLKQYLDQVLIHS